MLREAIRLGGSKLDCFDGYLPKFYARNGFQETKREPWNDDFAPADWDYETMGRPDIVFMALPERT